MHDHYLITGGAGFIGTNVADHYLGLGRRVTVFDDFSRQGSEGNVRWLKMKHGAERLTVVAGDVRAIGAAGHPFAKLVERAQVVFHLAGQVAVTNSVRDPRHDFEVNALGTFNVLEAVRRSDARPIVIYSSTNKVYGKMADLRTAADGDRYRYLDAPDGISEDRPLDPYSPYGCSKAAGDQYVLDYARMFGLRTVCFRQSCIYGPHQHGLEDQGWVAWFAIRALEGEPVTIFGDGRQIRDVLYVGDLVAAYDAAVTHVDRTCGRAYNVGGGPGNTLSLLELVALLREDHGCTLEYELSEWRPGDQLVFVGDVSRAHADFGWKPTVAPAEGLRHLVGWLRTREQRLAAAMIS
jgi:CDP-paratose 2-epimerase